MDISIVIRTFNEAKHLPELLAKIRTQKVGGAHFEIVVVDSGSTDETLNIAQEYNCRIVHIGKDDFTFGRSLNLGCKSSRGEILVFVSGHCIPTNDVWLVELIQPLVDGSTVYSYGRQIGNGVNKFSEQQLFRKYYPEASNNNQDGFFCNNANAALCRNAWERFRFDEDITGLEDMEMAKRIKSEGMQVSYVATSVVFHIHDESWGRVKTRYEREAVALQHILPEIHIRFLDFLRYVISAILLDFGAALQERKFSKVFIEVIAFRLMQFWGAYCGNHEHRKLSKTMKEKYFYPR